MKVRTTLSGNVKITLSNEQAKHLLYIVNYSGLNGKDQVDYIERERTSMQLWGLLEIEDLDYSY